MTGWTRNLGLDGVLLVTPQRFEIGAAVDVDIAIPLEEAGDGMRVVASARVLRSDPEGTAFVTALDFENIHLQLPNPELVPRRETLRHTRSHV